MKKYIDIIYLRTPNDFSQHYRFIDGRYYPIDDNTDLDMKLTEVGLVLSPSYLVVLNIKLPKNSKKYIKQLLPNLAEPFISEPIEMIEFLIIKIDKDSITFAAINKQLWQKILKHWQELGWQLKKVWVDALCLPIGEDDAVLFNISKESVLWRGKKDEVFCGNKNLLERTQPYQSYVTKSLTCGIESTSPSNNGMIKLLSYVKKTPAQITIEIEEKARGKLKFFIAMLSTCALTLWTINLYVYNWQKKRLADNYYNESVMLFHQVLPQYKKIPTRSYATRQLSQVLNVVQVEPKKYWYNWLEILNEALTTHEIEIFNIQYVAHSPNMSISLRAKNNKALESFQKTLKKKLNIKMLNNSKSDEMVNTLEIQP